MLGEQLEQDTLTAEDITDLRLVDSEYMSGTRTRIHDFDCKVKGEVNRLQYTLEYHDDGEGFTIHTEKDDIWNRMSTQELERLDVKLGQEVLYYHYHNKTVNADTLDELREIREEIMEEESSYFTAISQRVWTDYDKKKKNYLEKLRYRKKKNLWKRLTEYQNRFQQRTSASQMMSLDRVQQKKSSVLISWQSSF